MIHIGAGLGASDLMMVHVYMIRRVAGIMKAHCPRTSGWRCKAEVTGGLWNQDTDSMSLSKGRAGASKARVMDRDCGQPGRDDEMGGKGWYPILTLAVFSFSVVPETPLNRD